jgi:ABC-2 type transport system ATP-binding protein
MLDRGEITIGGHPHTSLEAKRRTGFMAENPYLYNHLTGREYLTFSAGLLGIEMHRTDSRVTEVLETVSMTQPAEQKMRTYSKGMLQRIALGQALLGDPELLILDEPMSGLDPIGRRDFRDVILAQKARGTTVFFSSHIIPDVETICDRIATVIDGSIRGIGAVRDLVAREVESYEVTFSGVDPDLVTTPVVSAHVGSDVGWVRVDADRRDALIRELAGMGAQLISLSPVRSTLEDLLMDQFKGSEAS